MNIHILFYLVVIKLKLRTSNDVHTMKFSLREREREEKPETEKMAFRDSYTLITHLERSVMFLPFNGGHVS